MEIFADAFMLPKAGNTAAEYEDAAYPQNGAHHAHVGGFRCAVGDGATESAFAGEWARLITKGYCKGQIHPRLQDHMLEPLRALWRQRTQRGALPWYAEQKVATGAFAALIGLKLRDGGERRWNALAVGDCCLFQVRADLCIAAFPLETADAFNNSPYLLSSQPMVNAALATHLHCAEGEWQPEDVFYLMSDALAAWFLRSSANFQRPWTILNDLETEGRSFEQFIDNLRREAVLKNDDVTLLRVACYETGRDHGLADSE